MRRSSELYPIANGGIHVRVIISPLNGTICKDAAVANGDEKNGAELHSPSSRFRVFNAGARSVVNEAGAAHNELFRNFVGRKPNPDDLLQQMRLK